jgi:selenocysteine lyase/cysteine desulfurase
MAGRTLVAGDAGLTGRRLEVRRGVTAMIDYETPLTRRLIEGLGAFEGLRVQGITNPNAFARRVPTVSLTVAGRDPKDLAEALAAEEIYVWSGHNYAVEPATALGLMDSGGVLRIGLAHYNTAEEVERILGALGRCLG